MCTKGQAMEVNQAHGCTQAAFATSLPAPKRARVHESQAGQRQSPSPTPWQSTTPATVDAGRAISAGSGGAQCDAGAAETIEETPGMHDDGVKWMWPNCSRCNWESFEIAHAILRARKRLPDGSWGSFKNWPFCLVCFAAVWLDVHSGMTEPADPDVEPVLWLGSPDSEIRHIISKRFDRVENGSYSEA